MSGLLLVFGLYLPWIVFLGVVAQAAMPTGGQIVTKPLSWLKPDPNQPRKSFDESGLLRLGESMKVRQIQPILCRPDGTILDGERRWRAAQLVGLKTLDVIVTEETLTDSQIRVIQLTANMQRADFTAYEQWIGCAELMMMNPSWALKDLAQHLHLDPSMVTRLLSPSKCILAVQEALKEGKIGTSDCYAISKLPQEDQAGLLALKLSGGKDGKPLSRDDLEKASKKKRNGSAPAVKVAKVKCLLPSGVQVQVSGEGVSLEESIEALASAMREMKKALEQGYTAKTFALAMRDKSAKG